MARLNEAPAPGDPVELLRRKYTRQNKDIARVNSAQAVRIRNLEGEVSRLLAENLELRSQIITQESQPHLSRNFINHVGEVRLELDLKLREIATLVAKLDRPVRQPRRSSNGTRVPKARPRTSEERMQMMESLLEQEGRLPAILENKSYPRRTLDAQEFTEIVSDPMIGSSDSPDIGPPPISNFMIEDPVKIDLPPKSKLDTDGVPEFDPALSVNLEQRRKRKDMSTPSEHTRTIEHDATEIEKKDSLQPVKSGAKRKFNIGDDISNERESKPGTTSSTDLRNTRRAVEDKSQSSKVSMSIEKPVAKVQREIAIARARSKERTRLNNLANTPSVAPVPTRKALEPKTSNTDIVNSPKKTSKPPLSDDSDMLGKINEAKKKERPRSRNEVQIIAPPQAGLVPSVDNIPEPETPAAPRDLFSPTSSAPSTTRQTSRDTPPPQEIGQDGEGHRPSRRSRASVSYAEPNLRDKMRRPTKDLLDAVTGEGKSRRVSSISAEENPQNAVRVKPEPGTEDDIAWKSKLPTASSVSVYSSSPLSGKVIDGPLSPEIDQRKRRSSQLYQNSGEDGTKSNSGAAISALISGSRKVKPEPSDQDPLKVAFKKLEQKMADMDIYEFSGSPPHEAQSLGARKLEDRQRRRVSRSQSSAGPLDLTETGRVSQTSRRRQSTLEAGMGAAADVEIEEYKKGEKAPSRSTITQTLREGERSDRFSARRRSMML